MNAEYRLRAQGIVLPPAESPSFNYLPMSIENGVAYLAGHQAKENGEFRERGRAGIEVGTEEAARQMSLSAQLVLSRLKHELGNLDLVRRILHMNAYVACDYTYEHISTLADHASNVFITAFGEAGRHPRSVLGMMRLPQNAPVMIDVRVAIET
jgi:enamine deaminase RidA (YjgF/YER057c/UK114 family)